MVICGGVLYLPLTSSGEGNWYLCFIASRTEPLLACRVTHFGRGLKEFVLIFRGRIPSVLIKRGSEGCDDDVPSSIKRKPGCCSEARHSFIHSFSSTSLGRDFSLGPASPRCGDTEMLPPSPAAGAVVSGKEGRCLRW